ncbi:unnamed protein product [Closterium sp. NIES-64]|nr:unnamed protein product [Closterium sp. NIES-64]
MNDERRNAATGGAPWRQDMFHLSGGPYHSPEEGRRRRDERGRWRGHKELGGGEVAGGMHASESSRAGTTLENEAEDAAEEHAPIPEQAGESPDEPDGAEERESAPTHEAAELYDEAEEDEGAAEWKSRRDDPDLEQRGAWQQGEGRGNEQHTPSGGGQRGEFRSPERQWHQRGASRSPRQQRRWHQRPREESRSPVRCRGREGRRDKARGLLVGQRWEREEREGTTRRQGIGSGRRGTAGVGRHETGEGGATERARPGAGA